MTSRFLVTSLYAIFLLAGFGYVAFIAPTVLAAPPTPTPGSGPTSAVTPNPGDQTYTVQSGDSFWSIAQKMYGNGSKYKEILKANNLTENSKLRVGSVLVIPALPGVSQPSMPGASQPSAVTPTTLPILQPTAVPTLPPVSLVSRTQPTAAATVAESTASPPASKVSSALANHQLLTALDILSGIFAATSVICAFLAYQSYVRAKRFERMVIVRRRARSHPDLI